MTDFNNLELNKEISDMEGDEAKETLSEFMESHKKNSQAYDEVQTEFEDRIDELENDKEELQETLTTVKSEYAEKAAEKTGFTEEVLMKRFDFQELRGVVEEIEDADEFSEEEEEETEEEQRFTQFAERDEKGKTPPDDTPNQYREQAKTLLAESGLSID